MRLFLLLVLSLSLSLSCARSSEPTNSQQAQQVASQVASARVPYIPKNNVEFNNYNERQKLADDPTVILWCTSAFPIPASPLFTVPIVGKLTSGNKRPYETSQVKVYYSTSATYSPELPGPDGMFGSSGEYRYGFMPNRAYADFYNMPTYCTTEPTIWQRQNTSIVMESDPNLLAAQRQAQALLAAGDTDGASKILTDALKGGR